jgi:hypothetical protein
MAFDPLQAGQQARGSRLQEQLAASGHGLQQYQTYQGGLGTAEQIAQARYGALAQSISGLTQQIPVYGGSPLGSLLGSLSGSGAGIGSMLNQQSMLSQLLSSSGGGIGNVPGGLKARMTGILGG